MRLQPGPKRLRAVGIVVAVLLVTGSPFVLSALRSKPSPKPAAAPPLEPSQPGAAPASFVGLTDRGDVVVAESANGRPIRTILRPNMFRREDRLRNLTLSPDRMTLYFVVHHDDDCSDIGSVPVAGGPMRIVARGDSPAVSPDGERLAYVSLLNCGGMRARVVVQDLVTGRESSWEEKPGNGDFFPRLAASVAWSPDPRFLMVTACGADACGPSLLDTRSPNPDLWAATKPVPGLGEDQGDAFWGCWTVRGRRGTVVVKIDYSSSDGSEPHPINEVDFATGKVRELIPVGKGLGCFTFDAAGDHALFVRDGVAHRWNPAATAIIRRGYAEAVW